MSNGTAVSGTVPLESPDGPRINVEVDGSSEMDLTDPYPDSNTVDVTMTGGNATFSSAGQTEATVHESELNGEWTNVTAIDATGSDLTINPTDKPRATVGGGVTAISYRSTSLTDDATAVEYSASSSGTIEVAGFSSDTNWTAATTDGTVVDSGTTTADGTATISVSSATDQDLILFSNDAPVIDDSSATPSDSTTVTSTPVDLSVDISDDQFGEMQGDELSVTFYDGSDSQIGTDTLTSNGTASTQWDSVAGGSNQWYVVVDDSYGASQQSQTYTFNAPSTLYIYNESAPNELVSNAQVNLEFYFEGESGQIVTRNTSDGTIDMEGLPPDQPFVVVADADGYHPRRIYVDSLLDEQRVYLLPESEEYVDITFSMEDFTGRFPEDTTVMRVERELNGNWSTVQGDFFGGTGEYTAQLRHNQRHRLTLINTETGDTRRLGTLTPSSSGVQTIEVTSTGDIELVGSLPMISVSPSTRSLAAVSSSSVGVDVSTGNKAIDEWTVTVTSGGSVLHEETVTDGAGSIQPTFDLSGLEGASVTVDVEVLLEDGTTISETVKFGVREHYDHGLSLLSILSDFGSLFPGSGATTFLAVAFTVLITAAVGGTVGTSSEVLGGVAVGSVAFFAVIGWVGMDLLFAGGVTWVAAFALRRGI